MRRSIALMRPHGSGHLSIRTTKRDGPVYYGSWWVGPGKKVSRRIGPARQPGSKTGLTEKQANAKLARLIADYKPPAPPEHGDGIRFEEAGRAYLKSLKRAGRKKATLVAVESCLRVWVIPHLGHLPLDRVTAEDIEALVSSMEAKGLSAKSITNYLGTLNALYRHGMKPRVKWVTSNPCEGADLPAVLGHDEIRFLTPEQVDALIRAVPAMTGAYPNPYADLDRVLYRVAAMTGMREGELVALRWGDIDWLARKIRVRRNYVLGEDIEPKSQKSKRGVPMADEVAQTLAAWQPHDSDDNDLVFADPITATFMNNAAILRRFRRVLKLADLPTSTRFHDLRHTFATRMASQGVPLVALQAWLGHADIKTTMRYADYAPSDHEADLIGAAFARPEIPETIKEQA